MLVQDWLHRIAAGLLLAALVLFSLSGVRVARAEPLTGDVIPSAEELLRIEFDAAAVQPPAAPAPPSEAQPAACGVSNSRAVALERREALAELAMRIQAEMKTAGEEGWKPLNGRGYNYPRGSNPMVALDRIQAEAARIHRAAETAE